MEIKGTLTFFCGKMGAGKTSMSLGISRENNAVLLSEDDWLAQVYPDQIKSFDEYLEFSRKIKPLVKKLAQSILLTGTHVVMDFPANTVSQRAWFKALVSEIEAPHKMIYLDASNEVCLRHIAKRKLAQPERAAFDTEEVFFQVSQYFEEPGETEDINVRKIGVHT